MGLKMTACKMAVVPVYKEAPCPTTITTGKLNFRNLLYGFSLLPSTSTKIAVYLLLRP